MHELCQHQKQPHGSCEEINSGLSPWLISISGQVASALSSLLSLEVYDGRYVQADEERDDDNSHCGNDKLGRTSRQDKQKD